MVNTIHSLPRGFEQSAVLVGGVGVTDTVYKWGALLRRMYNTTRVGVGVAHGDDNGNDGDNGDGDDTGDDDGGDGDGEDLAVTRLSVFTDNGAFYNPSGRNGPATEATGFLHVPMFVHVCRRGSVRCRKEMNLPTRTPRI